MCRVQRGLAGAAGPPSLAAMHPALRRLATLGLFCVAALHAAAFEGRISLGFSDKKNREQQIDYAIKGTRVRFEPKTEGAQGAAVIMDLEKREMTFLMTGQKMYMTMPLTMPAHAAAATGAASEAKLEKTGRTEKILDYLCEEYVSRDGGQETHLWITDQLGSFMGLSGGNPMGGMMGGRGAKSEKGAAWERLLKEKGGVFPLRVVVTDKAGKESFRLETKKIEAATLPEELFAPPAGFQKFAMPAIPGFGG